MTRVWQAVLDLSKPSRWPCWKGYSVIEARPIRSQKPHRVFGLYFLKLRFVRAVWHWAFHTRMSLSTTSPQSIRHSIDLCLKSRGRVSSKLTKLHTLLPACEGAWTVPAWTLLILIIRYQIIITYDVAYIIINYHLSLTCEQHLLMRLQFLTLCSMNLTKILHQRNKVTKKMAETETFSLARQNLFV